MEGEQEDIAAVGSAAAGTAAVVIAVPDGHGESGSYMRLGRSMHADETGLLYDPARLPRPGAAIDTFTAQSPFAEGIVNYSTGSIQIIAPYGYLRLGVPTAYEGWMPASPGAPLSPTGEKAAITGDPGVLLVSPSAIQFQAASLLKTSTEVAEYTTDVLEVVGNDTHLVSARRAWGAADNASSATFARCSTYAVTLGSNIQLTTGNTVTQYLGDLSQVGLGGYLTVNYGTTQSVYGGQVVAANFGAVEVSGWRSAKLGGGFDLAAAGVATITSSPVAAEASETGAALAARGAMVVAMLSAVADGAMDIATAVGPITAYRGDTSGEGVRVAMERASDEIIAVEAMVALLQGMTVLAGVLTRIAATSVAMTPHVGIQLDPGGLQLEAYDSRLFLSGVGIYSDSPILNHGYVFSMFG